MSQRKGDLMKHHSPETSQFINSNKFTESTHHNTDKVDPLLTPPDTVICDPILKIEIWKLQK